MNNLICVNCGKIDMVIIDRLGYFALNFKDRTIIEITFEEAFGNDFFDWSLGIAMMSKYNKQMYMFARGEDGCGLHRFFFVRDDLQKARNRELKEMNEIIKFNGGKK
jgi:hypothetical protein